MSDSKQLALRVVALADVASRRHEARHPAFGVEYGQQREIDGDRAAVSRSDPDVEASRHAGGGQCQRLAYLLARSLARLPPRSLVKAAAQHLARLGADGVERGAIGIKQGPVRRQQAGEDARTESVHDRIQAPCSLGDQALDRRKCGVEVHASTVARRSAMQQTQPVVCGTVSVLPAMASRASRARVSSAFSCDRSHGWPQLSRTWWRNSPRAENIGPGAMLI